MVSIDTNFEQPGFPAKPGTDASVLQSLRRAISELIRVNRPFLFILFSIVFSLIATYRNFGFDKEGDTGIHGVYPYVADGWGIWFWFAHLHLDFYLFFFIVNLVLAAQILLLAFPRGSKPVPFSVSIVVLLYFSLWFLFGQARYGMASALIAPASIAGGLPLLALSGTVGVLVHKGIAGGVLLLALWILLRGKKYGVYVATFLCASLGYLIHTIAGNLLAYSGYDQYLNWESLPSTNTPLKYYYILAVLLLWNLLNARGSSERAASNSLLVLTLLFLPFSYYNVFAGRSFELFAAVFLIYLLKAETPPYVRRLLLVPYLVDLGVLLFLSGHYF